MESTSQANAEIAVVGAGPAGLTAAIAMASAGMPVVVIARKPVADSRTTALLASSVTALETLGVWPLCAAEAAPLRTMRIADDTGRLLRAPEARFEAAEIGLPAFGYNIENRHLMAALEGRAAALPGLRRIEAEAVSIACEPDMARIALASGESVAVRLIIGADGHRSLCRAAAGIESEARAYPQVALTFNIRHARPHRGVSTEFHTPSGPFTLVPLPGDRSSIVCVVDADEADRLAALDDAALARDLEKRSHSILGEVAVEPLRGRFPLAIETARTLAARRIALVGEAGHRLPPIGAQGLNLGLRDAAVIAEQAVAAWQEGSDPGAPEALSRYDAARRADILTRTLAVDWLNRTLLSGFLPFQGARGLGLYLVNRIVPLRRAAMREGVDPAAARPRLMRGEALAEHPEMSG